MVLTFYILSWYYIDSGVDGEVRKAILSVALAIIVNCKFHKTLKNDFQMYFSPQDQNWKKKNLTNIIRQHKEIKSKQFEFKFQQAFP